MADTRRTWAALDSLFADNTAGDISAQDLRDGFQSLEPHVSAGAPSVTDDSSAGFDKGHVWINTATTPDTLYGCLDAAMGAAVWAQVYPVVSAGVAWGDITGTLANQTDLGTAAAQNVGYFATAAQGGLADSATQPGDDADTLGSGAATDGQVLTADGAGGAAWEAVPAATAPTLPIIVACSDETTALTATGNPKVTFRMPFAFTLSAVRASVTTAPTGSVLTVDINEAGTSVLSTKLTIDATTTTSVGAATAAVISDTALADNAVITIDIDTVGSTIAGAGLKVTLIGTRA